MGTEGRLYCAILKKKNMTYAAYADYIVCIVVSPTSSLQDNEPQETQAAEGQ